MPGVTVMQGSGAERAPFSADFQAAVRAEVDGIVKAPIFSQSNRCKRFLSHVVIQTLSGNAGDLKERTIGIRVFDRTNDYNTGDDSIVRVTANDVRKRLGQYYRESADVHPIQIELPRGSYVPEFRVQATRRVRKSEETSAAELVNGNLGSVATALLPQAIAEPEIAPIEVASSSGSSRRWWLVLVIVVMLVLAGIAGLGFLRKRASSRLPDLWGSFLHSSSPVLVCIDTHQLPGQSSATTEKFVDMVLRKQIIALDDAAVLSYMGAMLGKREIPFRVVGAEQTSLEDLRRQPVILIGAIDNKWTIRLTKDLPYRIEVANSPGSGSGSEKEPVASIIDSQHSSTRWSTDLSVPFNAWKSDYAVIARVDDATTGVPVLIEAGLGNDGTLAANELITSGGLSSKLVNEPSCQGKKNFEAVIETQIIDTKSGPPHVLRLTCW